MIECMVKIEKGHAVGLTAGDAATLADAEGGEYKAQFVKPRGRSIDQLGLWWSVCGMIADNYETEFFQLTKEFVSDTLKVGSGHYMAIELADKTFRLQPKSIAFNKLGQNEFNSIMDRAMHVAGVKFGPGLAKAAREEMERALSGKGKRHD
jgi:hypothetical protein